MKRALSAVFCLLFALALSLPAFADVIYVPNDSFYNKNSEECEYFDRRFVAAEGSCVQVSPENDRIAFELSENVQYNVHLTYTDSKGRVWGCIERDNVFGEGSGWIPLDTLALVYDDVSFSEDHKEEFFDPEGISPDLSGGAVFFEYPSSPRKWVCGAGTDFEDITYSKAWTDGNGVTWVYVTYHLGMQGWICADNPLAGHGLAQNSGSEGIIVDGSAPEISDLLPYDTLILDSDGDLPAPHKASNRNGILWLTLCITLGVAAVSAVLAFVLKKKKAD